jgi:hypothetical protein
MSTSFKQLLTDCLVALGDSGGAVWSRVNRMWPWCIEAMKTFPILRPMVDDHTNGAAIVYSYSTPVDFREVISIEYPISQQPPVYLHRKNRLDPEFYDEAGYYDVDHDYTGGKGWMIYVSGGVAALAHIKMQYLANHEVTDLDDDDAHLITIPDEYENILIANVVCRAYRERMSYYMQSPTAQTNVIMQYSDMVFKAEENYRAMVNAAQEKLAQSKVSAHQIVDKYDRVY